MIPSLLAFAAAEFGPLIAFLALSAAFNLKIAIAGAVAATLLDAGWRLIRRRPFTRLYLITTTLTLGFGAVDLLAATPFLIVYEAPITNLLTGAAFLAGAFGQTPLLQEIAQARLPEKLPATVQVRRFFRLFTLAWAAYFVVKAGVYVWLAAALPMAQAIALRSALGGLSLALMSVLSITQGRRLFLLANRRGWLGASPQTPRPSARPRRARSSAPSTTWCGGSGARRSSASPARSRFSGASSNSCATLLCARRRRSRCTAANGS